MRGSNSRPIDCFEGMISANISSKRVASARTQIVGLTIAHRKTEKGVFCARQSPSSSTVGPSRPSVAGFLRSQHGCLPHWERVGAVRQFLHRPCIVGSLARAVFFILTLYGRRSQGDSKCTKGGVSSSLLWRAMLSIYRAPLLKRPCLSQIRVESTPLTSYKSRRAR